MNYEYLICPVCGGTLAEAGRALRCKQGHSFDLAKEDYVNLLTGSKPADTMGDNKQAARFRRDFLNQDYYRLLPAEPGRCWISAAVRAITPPPWGPCRGCRSMVSILPGRWCALRRSAGPG